LNLEVVDVVVHESSQVLRVEMGGVENCCATIANIEKKVGR
jgi:hypothetical protein